ncbi:MAG TPA: NAD-dependent epimerase/dehydratase family protein [Solirubrobacteraceae bacterium]|nr:NAD-dependent epimerase/dehydratase family protein [Solirubrobacteraceae bacterium]
MKAAITGASGLIGRRLGALLDGAVLVPRDRPEAVAGADVVFHLAAQTVVAEAWRDPVATFEANVALTWRVLAAAAGARVVVASTDQVYGPAPPLPCPETAPLAPEGPYPASKAAADLLARNFDGDVVVARLANVYGPGDRHTSRLVPGVIGAVLAGRRPTIRGDGSEQRDLVHVHDAAEALLALAQRGEAGQAYNVGSGRARSVREVVDAVLAAAGSDLEPEVEGAAPPGEGGRRALDIAKIRAATGWAPRLSLEEGLRRTVEEWPRDGAAEARR